MFRAYNISAVNKVVVARIDVVWQPGVTCVRPLAGSEDGAGQGAWGMGHGVSACGGWGKEPTYVPLVLRRARAWGFHLRWIYRA